MHRENVWGFWVGVGLVGLGVLFIAGQVFHFNIMGLLWPVFILAVGAAFLLACWRAGLRWGRWPYRAA